jgi:hypothetical protein
MSNFRETGEKLKILSLGDIHGRNTWERVLFGEGGFGKWKRYPREKYPFQDYDLIVFVGDYVDSFVISDIVILQNLENIIEFSKAEKDRVKLLWGNHDLYYFYIGDIRAGFRETMKNSLTSLFYREQDRIFSSYQLKYTGENPLNILWTHAGISNPYYAELSRLLVHMEGEIAEKLEELFRDKHPIIFQEGYDVGGRYPHGGIFWARPRETSGNTLPLMQIVGHTPFSKVTSALRDDLTGIVYIDTLELGERECLVINLGEKEPLQALKV